MVMDVSDNGFAMLSNRELAIGQTLEFRCELFPQKVLDCRLEIRHYRDGELGTKIVEIDPEGRDLVQHFLREKYSERKRRARKLRR